MNRYDEDEEREVLEVLRSGNLSPFFRSPRGGPKTQEFEEAFAKYVGVKHAIAVSNGTSALHVALQAVGVAGEVVDTTVASFIASATSIYMAGANRIVWHDVDSETYCILADEALEKAQTIVAVDLLGNPIFIEELRRVAPNAVIVEDAAQALGSSYVRKGRFSAHWLQKCGALGDIATFSFQETKTITTGGEGGMIVTDRDSWAERARQLRNHGNQYSDAEFLCYNYRMTELQAAFGLAQLRKLDRFLEIQKTNASYIRDHLPRGIHWPLLPGYANSNWFILGCKFDEKEAGMTRAEFLSQCDKRGIDKKLPGRTVGPGYQVLIPERLFFSKRIPRTEPWGWPSAEKLKQTWLWLDIHRWRPLEEVKADLDAMSDILK